MLNDQFLFQKRNLSFVFNFDERFGELKLLPKRVIKGGSSGDIKSVFNSYHQCTTTDCI